RDADPVPTAVGDRDATQTCSLFEDDHGQVGLDRIEGRFKQPLPVDQTDVFPCAFDRDSGGNPEWQGLSSARRRIRAWTDQDDVSYTRCVQRTRERGRVGLWVSRMHDDYAHRGLRSVRV